MFKNLNLNLTILIALFVGLALPTFFTTIYLQNKNEQDLKNKLIKTQKELIQTLSSGLSRPMWEFMYDNAKDLVEPIFRNEDILEIKVIDLKSNNREFLKLEKMNIQNSTCKDSQIITLEENIVLNKLHLGTVFIKFSTCKIRQQIIQQRDNLWFIMGMQFLISFIILFLLINSKIILPIKKLITQSNTLAHKKLNTPFVWQQNDEIGLMGQSLEHTRVSLLGLFDKEQKSKDEIEELNKNLELKVEDRTKKLMSVNKELKTSLSNLKLAQEKLVHTEKMASLGNMVSGISHEINTPIGVGLTAVTHFQEITQDIKNLYHNEDMSEREFEEYLSSSESLANAINKNLIRASNLIGSFKKISVDQSCEEKRVFNLYEYSIDFINSMYGTLVKSKIKIDLEINPEININSYPGSYGQSLMILVMNSLLHGYKENEIGVIKIGAKQIDDFIILEYSDDGKGISEKNQKHIFEPFFTTKRGMGGSGLGLNILYNIVINVFKGKIKCESEPQKGVKFIITLPRYI